MDNNEKYNLVICGASCTADSPWKTWADLVEARYSVNCKNVGRKGIGNEAIITKTLAEALKTNNPIVAIMLTSVDKWDWYTQDKIVLDKIQNEKHTGFKIDNEYDGAYWGTGSHFPLWKEYYHKNYYSLRNMVLNTIKHTDLLIKTCRSKGWPFFIGADYSIFSYTESQSNKDYDAVKHNTDTALIDNTVEVFYNEIKDHIDVKGMLKTGDDSDLPVLHKRYGLHPGTAVHYEYCKKQLFPFFDKYLQVKNNDIENIVNTEQNLWKDTNR